MARGFASSANRRRQSSRDRALVALPAHNGCALARLIPAEVFAAEVFAGLGGPGFEAVPVESVAAVVLGPAEAGRRAAGLG